jgi:hypothetical protein
VSALANLQTEFQDYLLRGQRAVEAQVVGSARVPVATRLAIYGNAYSSRLVEALATNFPALAALLGEADFERLAADYVRTHDSRFFSIRYYGDELERFLATHADYAEAPVLAELARWEWTLGGVFDAPDAAALGRAALAGVPPAQWAQLRFAWHPSVRRVALSWNVPQLWQALTAGSERPPATLSAQPLEWLLWREQVSSYFRSLPHPESVALDAALRGRSFGELCELLAAELGEQAASAQAATLLGGWIDAGLIVRAA